MKPVSVLTLAALAVVAFGAIAEGIAPRQPPHDAETAALKAQVAELQQRLTALEARVDEINKPRMQKAR
jgi:hypothetical protein